MNKSCWWLTLFVNIFQLCNSFDILGLRSENATCFEPSVNKRNVTDCHNPLFYNWEHGEDTYQVQTSNVSFLSFYLETNHFNTERNSSNEVRMVRLVTKSITEIKERSCLKFVVKKTRIHTESIFKVFITNEEESLKDAYAETNEIFRFLGKDYRKIAKVSVELPKGNYSLSVQIEATVNDELNKTTGPILLYRVLTLVFENGICKLTRRNLLDTYDAGI